MTAEAEQTIKETPEPGVIEPEVTTIVGETEESTEGEVVEDSPQDEAPEGDAEVPEQEDLVAKALRENEELKKQLEELKNSNENVFEQNEALRAELENQEKIAKVAKENAELQAQLEAIKRRSLIDSLISRGSLNDDLREWAEALPYDSLQKFSEHAPKVKTILDQDNEGVTEAALEMQEWKKEQQRSRIL